MQRLVSIQVCAVCMVVMAARAQDAPARVTAAVSLGGFNPYADNNGDLLPHDYKGPRYRLNHRYPYVLPKAPVDPPWRKALHGKPIGQQNAIAYVQALKDYIAADIITLVNEYEKWDPIQAGWYDQPWIGPKIAGWPGREPIQGSYPGPGFDRSIYPDLKVPFMQDYVAVYYNDVAAYTLHRLWQNPNPYKPNVRAAQFQEGAIVIKLAMTTASGTDWAPMQGAAESRVYVPPPAQAAGASSVARPQILPVYAMQLDIIVKDSRTAPKTGWVFSTLVYDKDAPGATAWHRMTPLGAMWGNDPGVEGRELAETVVNPAAPAYAKVTLGWGLRLSGPNDGATQSLHPPTQPTRISSCMSCHGSAEYPATAGLLPLRKSNAPFVPGSPQWDQWFQDRPGTQPQTTMGKHAALDYDMVSRQALLNWDAARGGADAVSRAARQMQMLRARGAGHSQ